MILPRFFPLKKLRQYYYYLDENYKIRTEKCFYIENARKIVNANTNNSRTIGYTF